MKHAIIIAAIILLIAGAGYGGDFIYVDYPLITEGYGPPEPRPPEVPAKVESAQEYEETEICNVDPDHPEEITQKMEAKGWEFVKKSKCSVLIQTDTRGGMGYTLYDSFIFRRPKIPPRTCWEYQTVKKSCLFEHGIMSYFDFLGSMSWEYIGNSETRYIFKRPVSCK